MVEVLEQESKESFTLSPSLIYQIIAGKSYYINTIVTNDGKKHLQGVRPCETIEDVVGEKHKRMSKHKKRKEKVIENI